MHVGLLRSAPDAVLEGGNRPTWPTLEFVLSKFWRAERNPPSQLARTKLWRKLLSFVNVTNWILRFDPGRSYSPCFFRQISWSFSEPNFTSCLCFGWRYMNLQSEISSPPSNSKVLSVYIQVSPQQVHLRRYERLGNCLIIPSNFEFKTPLFHFLGNLSEILGLIRVRQHFDVDSFGSTLPQYCSASFSTVITQKQSGPLKFLIKIQFTEYQGEAMTLTKKNKGTNYTYIHSSPWE